MDKGDILSILAALLIVSVAGIVFHPPAMETGPEAPVSNPPESVPTPPITASPAPTLPVPLEPARISYTTGIWSYPRCYLPDNLTQYGGSDPLWKESPDIVSFAYIEEARGGVTETFHVPYTVWRLNCSVSATVRPEAAHFRMALVERESGMIIEGADLRYPGTIVKNVERGGKDFYIIVSVDDVDSYRITLETLPGYL
ncbi:hypothetical protein [Methanoculleus sp.]|uniref:hypothetical protein n=1 Tax=Methanoculleus sp. TaxID=90427 RepID=UPI0025EF20AE|nr:hypothetical protein [Methanoculleus sp.]